MQVQNIPGLNNNKTICKTSHNFLASFVFEERLKASLFFANIQSKKNFRGITVRKVLLLWMRLPWYAPSAVVKSCVVLSEFATYMQ